MTSKTLTIVAIALGLGGCDLAENGNDSPLGLRDVSPAALAALPPGIDPAFLVRDSNGCYGLAVEKTEPQTGVPLLAADGQQVCDA